MKLKLVTQATIVGGALSLGGVLLPTALAETPARVVAQDSVEVSRLLREAKVMSGRLATTTDQFNSYARSRLDWQTHAEKAREVKSEVNALGAHLSDLEALTTEAAPWQQGVIQDMRPILEEIAQNTEFVIEHIRENPGWLAAPEYEDALENKHELATQLAKLTRDSVSYADAKSKLEELRIRLD